jgi:hypothetical protein
MALFGLTLLAHSAAGQTSAHQRPASPPPGAQAKSAAAKPRLSDSQLEAAIRAKFANSKSANQFRVHVQGGVATIEGKTDVVQHKGAATRMAKVAGAVAVQNKVEVSEAAKKKAADNLEEGRRRVQVKRSESRTAR